MSVQLLPYELLKEIFRALCATSHRKNVANCALVCKSWQLPACHVLYEELLVSDLSELLKEIRRQSNTNFVFCRVLKFFSFFEEPSSPPEHYEELFSHLPNVQTISLDSCLSRYQQLDQLAKSAKLMKRVENIVVNGLGYTPEETQSYYNCTAEFKKTLKYLMLKSVGTTVPFINGRFENTATFLSNFTALYPLDVDNRVSQKPVSAQPSMFQLLRSCPNLAKFRFKANFNEPELNISFNHSKLRYMDISLPEITGYQISYIVTNVTQLEVFKLKCKSDFDDTEPKPWLQKINADQQALFRKYLSGIDKVEINIDGNWKIDIFEYWSFACEIISNNVSRPTHVLFDILDNSIYISERNMIVSKCADNAYLHCGIDYDDLPSSTEILASPELLQSIVAPTKLSRNNVESYYIQHIGRKEDILYHARLNIIESFINCFKNLNNFGIVRLAAANFSNYSFTVNSRNIEYKPKEYGPDENESVEEIKYDSLQPLSRRPIIPSDKLAYARLRSMHSTEDISSLLNHFPSLKYLKLIDCGFTLNDKFNITIDLNDLQLKHLQLDISQFVEKGEEKRTVMFQIEEENDQTSCFMWNQKCRLFEEITLRTVNPSFFKKHGPLASSKFITFFIKCHRIDQFELCASLDDFSETCSATVNLKHNTCNKV